ncbi:MAG: hypothetical protein A3F70_16290 [Acidobacteria bacterium RIFCSPLOWO2_12_FULL_67_14]|nr:MAG: hypothetical protein A3H29_06985 [Acidobacteria bacterium RIFCSPLOWO2_02_FULL_67_21]OFW35455.1 MAG: hypothetical protein A3F70_16290 [Acidobacteria bacterium RIFCSPLOWO2_12_FULL_67_14]
MTPDEDYRALTGRAALGAVAARAAIGLTGADRASFLQGLLTNDIRALAPGTGCYAAWLTPQGRMLMDLHVLNVGDRMVLDVPAELMAPTLQRLDQSLFSEDVQFEDLSAALTPVWIHGPSAAHALEQAIGVAGLASWAGYQNAYFQFDRSQVLVTRISQLGVPGFCAYADSSQAAALAAALESAGAVSAGREAIDAARVESGYPVFGVDMTEDTIPLEAGIEDRALSFTKGCYVGQEVIVRVLHRGHGRVARRLVGLRAAQDGAAAGARIVTAGRDVGWVTSAARSPRAGPIAMGYVQRDFAAAGTQVEIQTPAAPTGAVVSDFPIAPAA